MDLSDALRALFQRKKQLAPLSDYGREIFDIQNTLNKTLPSHQNLEERLNGLRSPPNNRMDEEHIRTQQALQEAQNEVKQCRSELDQCRLSFANMDKAYNKLHNESTQKNARPRAEVERLQAEVERLQAELLQIHSSSDRNGTALAFAQSRSRDAEQRVSQLVDELADVRNEIVQVRRQAEAEVEEKEAFLFQQAQAWKNEQEAILYEQRRDVEQAQTAIAQMRAEVQATREAAAAAEANLKRCEKARGVEAQEEAQAARAKMQLAYQAFEDANTQLLQQEARALAAELALEAANTQLAQQAARASEAEEARDALRVQTENLLANLKRLEDEKYIAMSREPMGVDPADVQNPPLIAQGPPEPAAITQGPAVTPTQDDDMQDNDDDDDDIQVGEYLTADDVARRSLQQAIDTGNFVVLGGDTPDSPLIAQGSPGPAAITQGPVVTTSASTSDASLGLGPNTLPPPPPSPSQSSESGDNALLAISPATTSTSPGSDPNGTASASPPPQPSVSYRGSTNPSTDQNGGADDSKNTPQFPSKTDINKLKIADVPNFYSTWESVAPSTTVNDNDNRLNRMVHNGRSVRSILYYENGTRRSSSGQGVTMKDMQEALKVFFYGEREQKDTAAVVSSSGAAATQSGPVTRSKSSIKK